MDPARKNRPGDSIPSPGNHYNYAVFGPRSCFRPGTVQHPTKMMLALDTPGPSYP